MNETQPIGAVVVTHGELARELVEATRHIVGPCTHLRAVSIGWNDDPEKGRLQIEEAVTAVDQGRGVILLTDMFGGTPSNLALTLLVKNEREIVTGVNLPMVVQMASQTGKESLPELTLQVRDKGQRQIAVASELLGE